MCTSKFQFITSNTVFLEAFYLTTYITTKIINVLLSRKRKCSSRAVSARFYANLAISKSSRRRRAGNLCALPPNHQLWFICRQNCFVEGSKVTKKMILFRAGVPV